MLKQAAILVGGKATRLGQLAAQTPKPLLPVAGRPFLAYLLAWLHRAGLKDIVLLTGQQHEQFEAFAKNIGTWLPDGKKISAVTVQCSRETAPLGTGGALRNALPILDEQFFLLNGDSYFPADLALLGNALSICEAALALLPVADTTRYGSVLMNEGRIAAFCEKGRSGKGLIYGGVAAFHRRVVERMSEGSSSLETDLLPALACAGELGGIQFELPFLDIGLPETYAEAGRFFAGLA